LWVRFPQETSKKRKYVVEITPTMLPLFLFCWNENPEKLPPNVGKNQDFS